MDIREYDDNTTQSALRFIMAIHKTMGEEKYLSSVEYGLAFMLKSQFENGAWPQGYPRRQKNRKFSHIEENLKLWLRKWVIAKELVKS